jgi:hypothetical protein
MTRCRVCNRILKSKESVELGIGPVCRGPSIHIAKNPARKLLGLDDWQDFEDERQLKLFEENNSKVSLRSVDNKSGG